MEQAASTPALVFLVVMSFDSKLFLTLAPSGPEEDPNTYYSIGCADSKEKALSQFNSLGEAISSEDFNDFMGATMALAHLQPQILAVPGDNPELLKEFVIGANPSLIEGNIAGFDMRVVGVEVKSEILQYSVSDVGHEIMEAVTK